MAFIEETKSEGKKTSNYIKLVQGMPVIVQIIDETATVKYQHWLNTSDGKKVAVKCLGFGKCPVDNRNNGLPKDSPERIAFNKRYLVNVVDLTPAKKGTDGNWYYPAVNSEGQLIFPERDSLGALLTNVVPESTKEVKILERGPELFTKQLAVLDTTVSNDGVTPVGITHFPIKLVTTGTGRDTTVSAVHMLNSPLTINPEDYADKKHDLSGGASFSADEIQALLDGTSLSDVLAARKALEQLNAE